MRRLILVCALVLCVSAQPSATTCAAPNTIPAGAVVTPECTWIVEQVDPGEWMDNLYQHWVLFMGHALKISGLWWAASR